MRKVVAVALAAAVLAVAMAAPASGHRTGRRHHLRPMTVTEGYTSASGVVVEGVAAVPYLGSPVFANRVDFRPRRRDDRMVLEVKDFSGLQVAGAIVQGEKHVATFCGATDRAVPIEGGVGVTVYLWLGTCPGASDNPSVVTSGEATATFTDRV